MGSGGDLKALLADRRERVERALDGYLPGTDAPPARLHEAMRHSVFSGGKRLRPILGLLGCEVAGGDPETAMAPACATELVHTYSLIHDDLPAMDDDDVRRGRPTCHRAFDEATAILAGDALLTLAFELVASADELAPERRVAVARELAVANGSFGMVGGQVGDMEGEGVEPTVERVTFIHTRKTAMPLSAAVRVGGLAAGAGEEEMAALGAYGRAMGLAFQIADDLLDLTGTAEEMGKAVGKDEGLGKLTYPAAVGEDAARARARELTEEAVAALTPFGDAAWALEAIARYVIDRRS
jgi:geranylgeranyl diphosphate synthase type II